MTLIAYRLREMAQQLDYRLIRRNRRYASRRGPDGLPLPPPRLVTLVAGTPDIGWYLEYGETCARAVCSILRRNGVDIETLDTILDFGAGCGRMLRHWSHLQTPRLYATDYNANLIDWCRGNLPFATYGVNNLEPPLDYADDSFSLVYAFSIFTHLPEETQRRWVDELRRVIRPGGFLLITAHGESYLDQLTQAEQDRFRSGEMVVRHANAGGSNLCAAFHPREYLETRLLVDFEIVEFASVSAGETDGVLQDILLARKPVAEPGHHDGTEPA